MAKKKAKTRSTNPTFEESLAKLKQIVVELENGNLPLQDSLDKYEQGIASLKHCHAALASAEKRIEQLIDVDQDGQLSTAPFDDSASTERKHGTRRAATRFAGTEDPEFDDVDEQLDDDEEDYGETLF